MPARTWEVEEVAAFCQARHLFLHYTDDSEQVGLWTPHTKVAKPAQRAIYQHQAQLLQWMRSGDIRTCASPNLHRQSWSYAGQGRYVCELCLRLDQEMSA